MLLSAILTSISESKPQAKQKKQQSKEGYSVSGKGRQPINAWNVENFLNYIFFLFRTVVLENRLILQGHCSFKLLTDPTQILHLGQMPNHSSKQE